MTGREGIILLLFDDVYESFNDFIRSGSGNGVFNYEIGNDCFNSNARTCDNAGSSGSGNQDKNYAENDPAQTAVTGVCDELHDRSNKIRSEMFLYVDENSCIPTHRKPHKVKIYLNIVILNS